MNPIKEYFKKKSAERKFKAAGPGHRLVGNTASSQNLPSRTSAPSGSKIQRPKPSAEAQQAAAAALARVEQKQQPSVNWHASAIKAQAKKELELENAVKSKHTPAKVVQDSCPVLSVSGVYFTCPIVGPDVLPLNEIECKIKEFLYEQLESERGLSACLIIHTCNKNKEKVCFGIEILVRYLTNILDNPTEEKFRKIRIKNKVFKEKVAELEGAFDLLAAAGFRHQMVKQGEEEEEYFVFPEEKLEDLENLQILKDALLTAEPIVPVLDRNLKVLLPSQVKDDIQLPAEFFNLSVDDIRKEYEAKTEKVELEQQLRTKAMKQRDELRELHMYKYSLLRIRFPDGIILQATFHVHEKLSAVNQFIVENLSVPEREYDLLVPGSYKLTENNRSLLELKLVPACLLNFHWRSSDNLNENQCYLKPEIMCLLEDL